MRKISLALLAAGFMQFAVAADDITVLVLNDFHGQMQPNKAMVGASKISSFIQKYRLDHPNTVVVLAGDNYQGTALSNISSGQVDNEFFNHIGVKYSAIGNHDFDYGQAAFESWAHFNQFSFLAANVIDSSGSIFKYATPYGQISLPSGKQIAFIGLSTLETPETTGVNNIQGLTFTNPARAANEWVKFLNSSANTLGKPDTIVLLTHIPSEQESSGKIYYSKNSKIGNSEINYITKKVNGVSAVLSGHSHMKVNGFLNGVAVVQGASQGKDISVLHYDCHTQAECRVTPEVIDLSIATKELPNDPVVDKIIDKYYQQNKVLLNQVVTTSKQALSNIPTDGLYNINLTYTIADVIRKSTHSDIGMQNTYGIRRSLPSGEITYSMIYEVMPFDNTVTTLNITGKYLRELIEHSLPARRTQLAVFAGVSLQLTENGKIKQILVNGKLLDPKQVYSLATVNFLVNGGDGFNFNYATDVKDTNIPVREIITQNWLKNGVTISNDWQSITIKH